MDSSACLSGGGDGSQKLIEGEGCSCSCPFAAFDPCAVPSTLPLPQGWKEIQQAQEDACSAVLNLVAGCSENKRDLGAMPRLVDAMVRCMGSDASPKARDHAGALFQNLTFNSPENRVAMLSRQDVLVALADMIASGPERVTPGPSSPPLARQRWLLKPSAGGVPVALLGCARHTTSTVNPRNAGCSLIVPPAPHAGF